MSAALQYDATSAALQYESGGCFLKKPHRVWKFDRAWYQGTRRQSVRVSGCATTVTPSGLLGLYRNLKGHYNCAMHERTSPHVAWSLVGACAGSPSASFEQRPRSGQLPPTASAGATVTLRITEHRRAPTETNSDNHAKGVRRARARADPRLQCLARARGSSRTHVCASTPVLAPQDLRT